MPIELIEDEPANALTPVADAVSTALAEVAQTNNTISDRLVQARELGKQFAGVAFAVATVKGMDEATKARAAIREHRYAIQTLQKSGSKLLGAMQRQFNSRCEEIVGEVEALEEPIDKQIKAEEARKAMERALREKAEAERKQKHMDAIAAINALVQLADGRSAEDIDAIARGLRDTPVGESFEEFHGMAQQAWDATLQRLQAMADDARREAAELAAERERQAAFLKAQEEQKAQAAALAKQAEELRKAREEHEAELAAHAAEL
jgi:hypothetical protein